MMKNRCLNPNAQDYTYYGKKGIGIDPSWLTYEGFLASMGVRPDGASIDRIDNSKGYSRENCRWADRKTQARNRDYTLNLTHNGITLKVWEWAQRLGIEPKTIHHRLWAAKKGLIAQDRVFAAGRKR